MSDTKTDCREPDGITVGLIDSLITISRVLNLRLKQYHKDFEKKYEKDVVPNYIYPDSVLEALKDLHQDEDLLYILQTGHPNPNINNKDQQKMIEMLSNAVPLLKQRGLV